MSELRTNRIVPRDGITSGTFNGGGIIQVKQAVQTQPQTGIAGDFHASGGNNFSAFADIPGISVDITPSRSDSKILVSYHLYIGSENTVTYLRLLRDSTGLAIPTGVTNGTTGVSFITAASNGTMTTSTFQFLDSPATTSSITYKMQWAGNTSGYTLYLNRYPHTATSYIGSSSITVMEVSG
tara:strand:- start:499 stop:1044 length:546 start_codon:yes stop_codon:yes gene_type:complete